MRKYWIAFIIIIVFSLSILSLVQNRAFWPFHPLSMFTKPIGHKAHKDHFEFQVFKVDGTSESLNKKHTQSFGHIGTVLLINNLQEIMTSDPQRACLMLQYFIKALPEGFTDIQVFLVTEKEKILKCVANRLAAELK